MVFMLSLEIYMLCCYLTSCFAFFRTNLASDPLSCMAWLQKICNPNTSLVSCIVHHRWFISHVLSFRWLKFHSTWRLWEVRFISLTTKTWECFWCFSWCYCFLLLVNTFPICFYGERALFIRSQNTARIFYKHEFLFLFIFFKSKICN